MPESNTQSPLAVVLAAGQGTRMKSDLPKVLFPVRGRPMIDYVLDALVAGGVQRIVVVVGYRGDDVRQHLSSRTSIEFVEQTERLGTGHAVQMALPLLRQQRGPVVIVAGDSPMLQAKSVQALLEEFHLGCGRSPDRAAVAPESAARPGDRPQHTTPTACLLGTLHKDNPQGLGRIVRDAAGHFAGIVEEKDATDEQKRITEVNMSTYVFDAAELVHALGLLRNDNRQREYYLTDCPGILLSEGKLVQALPILQPCEALSINTIDELAAVEEKMKDLGYK
jgi:bifunctional UDP-N-acetylglucosamine pyrophosphorylase / glucosamine-1-phosphate N-acetyltransferase